MRRTPEKVALHYTLVVWGAFFAVGLVFWLGIICIVKNW